MKQIKFKYYDNSILDVWYGSNLMYEFISGKLFNKTFNLFKLDCEELESGEQPCKVCGIKHFIIYMVFKQYINFIDKEELNSYGISL